MTQALKLSHKLHKSHSDKRNLAWFNQVYQRLNMGGELRTSICTYLKTPTGWVIKP